MSDLTSSLASKVRKAILDHKAFKQNWKINILGNGSVITLRGAVPSKAYKQTAESIAKAQQGVVNVINELDIDQSLKNHPEDLELDENMRIPPPHQRPYADH